MIVLKYIHVEANFSSFQRQLNTYGFRLSKRRNYFHPSFQRGREDLLSQIKRHLPPSREKRNRKSSATSRDTRHLSTQPAQDDIEEGHQNVNDVPEPVDNNNNHSLSDKGQFQFQLDNEAKPSREIYEKHATVKRRLSTEEFNSHLEMKSVLPRKYALSSSSSTSPYSIQQSMFMSSPSFQVPVRSHFPSSTTTMSRYLNDGVLAKEDADLLLQLSSASVEPLSPWTPPVSPNPNPRTRPLGDVAVGDPMNIDTVNSVSSSGASEDIFESPEAFFSYVVKHSAQQKKL